MSIATSVARLAAKTHESIVINFEPEYRPPTPGSSAWSIIAKNIRLKLVVPTGRFRPNWVLARMLARTSEVGYGSRLLGRSSLSCANRSRGEWPSTIIQAKV